MRIYARLRQIDPDMSIFIQIKHIITSSINLGECRHVRGMCE